MTFEIITSRRSYELRKTILTCCIAYVLIQLALFYDHKKQNNGFEISIELRIIIIDYNTK